MFFPESFLTAFIPSPGSGRLKLGPLVLNAYGLCIAIGVIAGVWLANRRWVAMGGSNDTIGRVATFAVPGGIIGARAYHVITDWKSFRGRWGEVFFVWKGGLGIWGGVFLGAVVAWLIARRQHLDMGALFHAAAPAIPLAQGVGRWGNWFNIELFGRPTTIPWALEIPARKRPDGYESFATFHPTFLYEFLWNIGIVIVVIVLSAWLLKRFRIGAAFALYVALYTFGRFFIERIRIDDASLVAGLRVNEWVAAIVFLGAITTLYKLRRPDTDWGYTVAKPDQYPTGPTFGVNTGFTDLSSQPPSVGVTSDSSPPTDGVTPPIDTTQPGPDRFT